MAKPNTNRIIRTGVVIFSCWTASLCVWASSMLPTTTEHHIQISSAVFSGNVVDVQSYLEPADGQIYTRTAIRVEQAFKGTLPPIVKLMHRGGTLADRGEIDGF